LNSSQDDEYGHDDDVLRDMYGQFESDDDGHEEEEDES
jgi:nitrogen fixation-related uncharacterized protein